MVRLKPQFSKDEGWWVGHDAVIVTLSHAALDVQGLSCVLLPTGSGRVVEPAFMWLFVEQEHHNRWPHMPGGAAVTLPYLTSARQ